MQIKKLGRIIAQLPLLAVYKEEKKRYINIVLFRRYDSVGLYFDDEGGLGCSGLIKLYND